LRERVLNQEEKPRLSMEVKKGAVDTEKALKKSVGAQRSQKSLLLGSNGLSGLGKVAIPKLNLEVLPNYHKKSEKCLNEALLAVYQEKHGPEKVC
jgi:hypothetical protein